MPGAQARMTFGLMSGEASDDPPRGRARPANARRGGLNQTNCSSRPPAYPRRTRHPPSSCFRKNPSRGGRTRRAFGGSRHWAPPAIAPADQPPRRGHRAVPAADSPPSALRHHLVADTVGSARGPGSLMVASPTAGGTRAVGIGGMLVGFGVIAEGCARSVKPGIGDQRNPGSVGWGCSS